MLREPIPIACTWPVEKKPVENSKQTPKRRELAKRPKRAKPAPASRAALEAATRVVRSNRDAARQTVISNAVSSVRRGVKSRGEQGTAYVRFRIDDNGNVLTASIARPSGYLELDAEVLDLVRRASPAPAPPSDANRTITAPVRFTGT
ncbi:energy transducer TonB family protein [Pseudochelatococcus sp. B33]